MNKERRKKIEDVMNLIDSARSILKQCLEEEQDYLNSIPETLQSEYETADEAVNNLEDAISNLEDALSNAEGAMG